MIHEILKAWRLHKEYGTRAAAKIIGLSAATYNRIERGHKPDCVTTIKIINFLFRETP